MTGQIWSWSLRDILVIISAGHSGHGICGMSHVAYVVDIEPFTLHCNNSKKYLVHLDFCETKMILRLFKHSSTIFSHIGRHQKGFSLKVSNYTHPHSIRVLCNNIFRHSVNRVREQQVSYACLRWPQSSQADMEHWLLWHSEHPSHYRQNPLHALPGFFVMQWSVHTGEIHFVFHTFSQ